MLAVDQDILGKQAQQKIRKPNYRVWVKPLECGSYAIGIFNLANTYQSIIPNFKDAGLRGNYKIRDSWQQKDISSSATSFTTKVPPHGVTLIKVINNDI